MENIDWGAFALVFGIALLAGAGIVSFYALGLRLLATGSRDDAGADGAVRLASRGERPLLASVAGFTCLGIGIAGVLVGLWLIIPQFH